MNDNELLQAMYKLLAAARAERAKGNSKKAHELDKQASAIEAKIGK